MEAHAARSPRGRQRDDACSFWYTLIRYFSPMKPAQTPPAPPASNLRPPPRRLRKRRRPSRPPLPILCNVISVEDELVSKDNSWAAAHYVLEENALELDLQGECQQEGDECDLLLCCHLNQFVPHTLETIEEVDGEHAYGQGSNAALERQLVHILIFQIPRHQSTNAVCAS